VCVKVGGGRERERERAKESMGQREEEGGKEGYYMIWGKKPSSTSFYSQANLQFY
jgi:hypothetical protein